MIAVEGKRAALDIYYGNTRRRTPNDANAIFMRVPIFILHANTRKTSKFGHIVTKINKSIKFLLKKL